MGKPGIQKIARYSDAFKATEVRLIDLPEVLIQDVAAALDIRSCCHDGANRYANESSWPRARSSTRRLLLN
jgi:hypothetical protein